MLPVLSESDTGLNSGYSAMLTVVMPQVQRADKEDSQE